MAHQSLSLQCKHAQAYLSMSYLAQGPGAGRLDTIHPLSIPFIHYAYHYFIPSCSPPFKYSLSQYSHYKRSTDDWLETISCYTDSNQAVGKAAMICTSIIYMLSPPPPLSQERALKARWKAHWNLEIMQNLSNNQLPAFNLNLSQGMTNASRVKLP